MEDDDMNVLDGMEAARKCILDVEKMSKMNEQESIKELEHIIGADNELAHIKRDEILIDFLKNNGFSDLAKAAEDIEEAVCFWYA